MDVLNFCQIGIRGLRQTPFEVEVARRLGHRVWTMADVDHEGIGQVVAAALQRAGDGTEGVYVSFDIDVVDPVFCPAQKYPEPAGLTSKQAITALRQIAQQAEIKGFDLCCLGPQYDDRVGTGSHLAARLFGGDGGYGLAAGHQTIEGWKELRACSPRPEVGRPPECR